ncbi:MAG: hypothetical protein GC201_03515 [Alphaproteobacteria bacterium]|nr:hypothetical protein [Alphaproteobacteria bacterium]
MLSALRKAANNWYIKALLALLVAAFMLWGVQSAHLSGPSTVAKVGDVRVTPDEYMRAFNIELDSRSREADKAYTADQAVKDGVDNLVLERLVTGAALDQAAHDLGLHVSDDRVAKAVDEYTAFRGPDGQFDKAVYAAALRQLGFTPTTFEKEQRRLIQRSDLLSTLGAGAVVPEALVQAIFTYLTEMRWVRYFVVPAAAVDKVPEPTAADLKQFYDAHHDLYTVPERRSYDYLTLTKQQLMDRVNVTDDEIKREYEARKSDFGTPEKRDLKQIIVPTQDEAQKLKKQIDGGLAFDKAAEQAGMSSAEVTNPDVDEKKLAYLGDEAAKTVFSQPQGKVSDPIETKLGWGLFLTEKITPGESKSLDQVHDQIAEQLRDKAATQQLNDLAEDARTKIATGATIQQLAKDMKVQLHSVKGADREGLDADGNPVPEVPMTKPFQNSLFSKEEGEFIDLEDDGSGGYFVIQLNKIIPAALQPFDAVKEKVTNAWIRDARRNAAQAKAKELAEKVRGGASMAEAAVDAGATLSTTPPFSRSSRQIPNMFSQDLLVDLFDARKDQVLTGPAAGGDAYVVAQISDTKALPVDPTDRDYRSTRDLIDKSMKNDIYAQYQTYLFNKHSVTRNQSLVNDLVDRLR